MSLAHSLLKGQTIWTDLKGKLFFTAEHNHKNVDDQSFDESDTFGLNGVFVSRTTYILSFC